MRPTLPILLSLLAACSSSDPGAPAPPTGERSEVVTSSTALEVAELRGAVDHLRATAERLGGFVASSELGERGRARLVLRVPSSALPELRRALDALDEHRTETERREDVTLVVATGAAALDNARATEARLHSLLEDRAATLEGVLAVEAELARVRERIEVLEAEDRVRQSRVALAEVEVFLHAEGRSPFDDPRGAIVAAFVLGSQATLAVGLGVVVVGAALTPSLLSLLVLAWLARAAWRMRPARA